MGEVDVCQVGDELGEGFLREGGGEDKFGLGGHGAINFEGIKKSIEVTTMVEIVVNPIIQRSWGMLNCSTVD